MKNGVPSENLAFDVDMLILARESRGLTQNEAAKKIGISQARLSKIETGLVPVTDDIKEQIADGYGYPIDFFTTKAIILGPGISEFFHRKKQSISVKSVQKIHAVINLRINHVAQLLKAVDIGDDNILHIDPDEGYKAAEIAEVIRSIWNIPPGPIYNLVDVIENAGAIVIKCDFDTPKIDALSRYVPGIPRMFFINSCHPGDRQRFTLAHELGHAIMHQVPHPDMEQQANEFAAAFLMPEKDIRSQLNNINIPKLVTLKPYWKVSMGALLSRASDLGKVTPRMQRHLWSQMSVAGYRTREPAEVDIPPEEPQLLKEVIRIHQSELDYSLSDLSKLMLLKNEEAQAVYDITPSRAEIKARLSAI